MPNRRLRIAHIIVQPVLVYDDGEEMTPGPVIDAAQLPVSKLASYAVRLPEQVAELAEKLATQQIEAGQGNADEPKSEVG